MITANRLPWLIDINVFMTPIANTSWDSPGVDSNYLKNGRNAGVNVQNAAISFDVVLARGTWTVELMHGKGSSFGIYSVQIDGVTQGTIDGYNVGNTYNNLNSVTGIVITRTQKYRLGIKMADKNPSAGGYLGTLNGLKLQRTA